MKTKAPHFERTLDLLHGLVLPSGATWGSVATDWQVADARSILEGTEPFHFLTRPRGGSKTTDLAAAAIAALLTQLPRAPGRTRWQATGIRVG